MRDAWRRRIIAFQATYYFVTGLWPLIHMASFEAVTGPKTDDWLVRMVGLLAAAIGAALAVAARDHARVPAVVVLSAGTALAFAGVDLRYGLTGRISPVYLADAAVELGILAGLAWTRREAASHRAIGT